jgi:hypothetical protein
MRVREQLVQSPPCHTLPVAKERPFPAHRFLYPNVGSLDQK